VQLLFSETKQNKETFVCVCAKDFTLWPKQIETCPPLGVIIHYTITMRHVMHSYFQPHKKVFIVMLHYSRVIRVAEAAMLAAMIQAKHYPQ